MRTLLSGVRFVAVAVAVLAVLAAFVPASLATSSSPIDVPDVLRRLSEYVAGFGAKTPLIVAIERCTQRDASVQSEPRQLVAEWALVRAPGAPAGWMGLRDVVEVDGKPVVEGRERLLKLLTRPVADASEFTRLAAESARFNAAPRATGFEVPTTVLLLFRADNLARFSFAPKGTTKVAGIEALALDFVETRRPAMLKTDRGEDVPMRGTVWVVPRDGTVVRTRVHFRGFADTSREEVVHIPGHPPAPPPGGGGGEAPRTMIRTVRVESELDIDVTYRPEARTGIWLPFRMSQTYHGAFVWRAMPVTSGRLTSVSEYSDYRCFDKAATIVSPY